MAAVYSKTNIRQGIFYSERNSGNLYRFRLAEDGMQVSEVLDQIADLTGWNQVTTAKKIGVSQGTISKWRNNQQSPRKEEWDRVTDLIQTEAKLEPLRGLLAIGDTEVRVMGRIGAGSVIDPDGEQIPPEGLFQVSLPFPIPPGMIAFQVEGDSMYPKYDSGDIVVVRESQIRSTSSFIGQNAAVRLGDGRRYLKRIHNGTRQGLYRLESFNSSPIQDVEIVWVGEIHMTVQKDQVFEAEPRPRGKGRRAGRSA